MADSLGGLLVLVETDELVEVGVVEGGEDVVEVGYGGGELLLGGLDLEVLAGEEMGVAGSKL